MNNFKRVLSAVIYWKNIFFTGNDFVTPSQLVTALKHYDRLPNCIVELIKFDRGAVVNVGNACAKVEPKLKKT